MPVSILRRHGVEPDVLVSRLHARMRDMELREERLKKRFELPPFLKHFATNMNMLARQDKLPPVFGRDKEIQQVLEILCHRERANSVMLIGEPGVGKTAIVEGLARRIEFEPDTVPVRLRDCQVVNLQMNTMVAGTMLRGMFEDRIQNVIRELKERPNLILFVDEAHTMVGAGSALGAPSDAANVFKSVLARGEIRMVAATTLSEYKEYIQEDEALARRFRCVTVCEPSIEETRRILYSLRPRLERNYSVRLLDEVDRNRARDGAALHAPPAPARQSHRLARHRRGPGRDRSPLGSDEAGRRVGHLACRADSRGHGVPRRDRTVQGHREPPAAAGDRSAEGDRGRRASPGAEQGPAEGWLRSAGWRAAVPGTDRRRQDGTGQGGGRVSVRRREEDGSRRHVGVSGWRVAVDKLIGMPRGIVGSERGGFLTNQLKDNPYTVVLLDEVEKASPHLLNVFLQAFDEGWMTDGRGKRVYLSDAVVIMTSNIGSENFRKLTNPMGFLSRSVGMEQVQGEVMRELERRFSPEFRNRIDEVVLFDPLTHDEVRTIAKHYLAQLDLDPGQGRQDASRSTTRRWSAREGWLQPGVRRPLPEARHRRAGSSCRSPRAGKKGRTSR